MPSLDDLRPGDVMFAPIGATAGAVVALGQLMLGEFSWPAHVGIVTEATPGYAPWIVQAMPNGAELVEVTPERHWTTRHVYVRPAYPDATLAVSRARELIGTPYSFLDYLALALKHWGIDAPMLQRYITSSLHMICSQLVDNCLAAGGVHVFDDGRLPQDVVPSALFNTLMRRPGTLAIWPSGAWTTPAR